MVAGKNGVLCLESTPPGSTGAVVLLWHPVQVIVFTSAGVLWFEWQLLQAATELLCTSAAVIGKFLV